MPALDNKTIITEKHELLVTLLNELSTEEQYAVDNIEQRPTQHWKYKFSDQDEVSKVISMLHDGKFLGADRLYSDVIEGGLETYRGIQHHH